LRQIDLFEPLNCDMVVRPAVFRSDIIPVGYLLELIDKPLLLKFFALENNCNGSGPLGWRLCRQARILLHSAIELILESSILKKI
jgi:hypothetical protein